MNMGFCHPAASLALSEEETKFRVQLCSVAYKTSMKLVDTGSLSIPSQQYLWHRNNRDLPISTLCACYSEQFPRACRCRILGNKDHCFTRLFIPHFRIFCGFLLSKEVCYSSFSSPLLICPPLFPCQSLCVCLFLSPSFSLCCGIA